MLLYLELRRLEISILRVLLGCCVVSQLLLQNVVNARIVVVNLGKETPMDKEPQLLELDKENSA